MLGWFAANPLSKLKVTPRAAVDPRSHSVSALRSDLRQPLMHSHRIYFSPELSEDFEYRLEQSLVGPRDLTG